MIIDEYLNSEMSPEKMREIEERIGSDPRFAKKLKEVRILRTGIIRVGLKEKIDRMKELDKELSSDEELERMVKDPHYVVEDPLQMQNSQPVNGKSAKTQTKLLDIDLKKMFLKVQDGWEEERIKIGIAQM